MPTASASIAPLAGSISSPFAMPVSTQSLVNSPLSPLSPLPLASASPGTGLKAEYFDDRDFSQLKVTRTDAAVDFRWGLGSPDAQIAPDTFSVRWTGQVQALYNEVYTFHTTSDDGMRLWINGQQIINNAWRDQSATEYSGTIALQAGQKYDIRLEYYENRGNAVARLAWSSTSQTKQIIPTAVLYQPTTIVNPPPFVGTGDGLKAEYFDNRDFTNLKVTRTDETVNFDWGRNAPDAQILPDTFAVRWTGQILAQYDETYTFYTTGDDGIRLWVNGQPVINGWFDQEAKEYTGSIALRAGQKYDIKLEYYDNTGDAVAKLAWSSARQVRQIIPKSQMFSLLSTPPIDPPPANPPIVQTGRYNYGEALQKALYFYDAQRSGDLPNNFRVEWRGDAGLRDGADVGRDLSGGFHDAGDKMKFSRTIAYTASTLAWGMLETPTAYQQSGQKGYALDTIKWATDYLLKAFTNDQAGQYEFYTQVGLMKDSPRRDHQNWVAAEVMHEVTDRPSYKINTSTPDSAIAGQTAAAFASASILFRQAGQIAYADLLLDKAMRMFEFADRYRGMNAQIAPDGSRDTSSPYQDNTYFDELVWGATWVHKAILAKNPSFGDRYLNRAEQIYLEAGGNIAGRYNSNYNWQAVEKGAQVLLAELTNKSIYHSEVQNHLAYLTTGYNGQRVTTTPGGMTLQDPWGPLRHSMNHAFIALNYSDLVTNAAQKQQYRDFALKQVSYALGDNPAQRSYVLGFGNNPWDAVHHATANAPWDGWNQFSSNVRPRHLLYGALLGGPDANDRYNNDMTDYRATEVAIDYNAAFTGVLARLYSEFGGTPLGTFPLPEKREDEYFVEAAVNASGSNFVEIKAALNNRSAWTARVTDKLSFRYYFTLDAGMNPNDLRVSVSQAQGTVRSSIKAVSGNLYYAEIDFTGTKIFPGGRDSQTGIPHHRKEVTFRIISTASWNSNNDWSTVSTGVTSGGLTKARKIPVYDNGVKLFGDEPI